MAVDKEKYLAILNGLEEKKVTLVAVSKTKPQEDILSLYELGHKDFGENYVQELVDKQESLPADIKWHFIGHLQSNKVKYIAPFVDLIQSVDSSKLLSEINKQGIKFQRKIKCLLQIYIATEETKFGLDENELDEILNSSSDLPGVEICGLMGMSSFTEDQEQVKKEFKKLKSLFDKYPSLKTLSMGMSMDYQVAIEEGSNMVRIGSLLFGNR